MRRVTFVTGNDVKFRVALQVAQELGYEIDQATIDFDELQADGKTIALDKARKAFTELQRPVVITDDEWDIPGLKGFPGMYMKQVNEWFTIDDWLRLTQSLVDRRIIRRRHAVYKDPQTEQYFVDEHDGILLQEARGANKYTHLAILSFNGGSMSLAEELANPVRSTVDGDNSVWHQLGAWFNSQN